MALSRRAPWRGAVTTNSRTAAAGVESEGEGWTSFIGRGGPVLPRATRLRSSLVSRGSGPARISPLAIARRDRGGHDEGTRSRRPRGPACGSLSRPPAATSGSSRPSPATLRSHRRRFVAERSRTTDKAAPREASFGTHGQIRASGGRIRPEHLLCDPLSSIISLLGRRACRGAPLLALARSTPGNGPEKARRCCR
jgi:hypothetical protein